jgi:hypothetical protein
VRRVVDADQPVAATTVTTALAREDDAVGEEERSSHQGRV